MQVVASTARYHANHSAHGSSVFGVHRICDYSNFLHRLRSENAEPSRSTTLRVVNAIDQKSFALHTAKRKSRIAELIVAAAVESWAEERQVEGVARRQWHVLHGVRVHCSTDIGAADCQNRGVSLDRHTLLRRCDGEGYIQGARFRQPNVDAGLAK